MSFSESIKEGNIGEFVVWNLFSHSPTVRSVVDVRDDAYFQSVDVDFLIEDYNRQYSWMEVKTDYKAHDTGNFVYEVTSLKHANTIGCFEKTKAKYIAYYVPNSGRVYLLSVSTLRKYVDSHDLKLINMGDDAKGYLLDIGDLERTKVILGMYEVEKVICNGRMDKTS